MAAKRNISIPVIEIFYVWGMVGRQAIQNVVEFVKKHVNENRLAVTPVACPDSVRPPHGQFQREPLCTH
jgi:hypothetical protein